MTFRAYGAGDARSPLFIMTSFSLWRHSRPARPVPASDGRYGSLWRHSHYDVIAPRPLLRTYERTNERTDTLPRLIYRDVLVTITSYTLFKILYLGMCFARVTWGMNNNQGGRNLSFGKGGNTNRKQYTENTIIIHICLRVITLKFVCYSVNAAWNVISSRCCVITIAELLLGMAARSVASATVN